MKNGHKVHGQYIPIPRKIINRYYRKFLLIFYYYFYCIVFYLSFIITPFCSNASELVSSLLFAAKKKKLNTSMTFSQVSIKNDYTLLYNYMTFIIFTYQSLVVWSSYNEQYSVSGYICCFSWFQRSHMAVFRRSDRDSSDASVNGNSRSPLWIP